MKANFSLDSFVKLAQGLSYIATPIVVAIIGLLIQDSVSSRSTEQQYVKIAVDVLSDKNSRPDLRTWAAQLLNDNSPTKWEPETMKRLEAGQISFPRPSARVMGSSPMNTSVNISDPKNSIEMEIFIGQAAFGKYSISRVSENGGQIIKIAEGNNADALSDHFELGNLSDYTDSRVMWNVMVATSEGKNELYYVQISLFQGGKLLDGGSFEYTGTLAGGAKTLMGSIRLLPKK